MMGAWECRVVDIVAKASAVGEGTGRRHDGLPGVLAGDMSRQSGQRKHGTTRGSLPAHPHSEGIAYKPRGGEIAVCLRVVSEGNMNGPPVAVALPRVPVTAT